LAKGFKTSAAEKPRKPKARKIGNSAGLPRSMALSQKAGKPKIAQKRGKQNRQVFYT